jgi:hypothetical protein
VSAKEGRGRKLVFAEVNVSKIRHLPLEISEYEDIISSRK